MDSFELNKVLGALLFTCLIVLSLNITAGAVFSPAHPEKPGYDIAVPEQETASGPAAPAEPEKPIAVLLASADVKRGENAVKKCQTCHTFAKGEPNRVGPNLFGIVGSERGGHAPGFSYSDGMKTKTGKWTFEDLNAFLTNPKGFVPGTKMSYAGDKRASDRADIIAFLNKNSENPLPLPQAAEAPAPAAPAPAAAPADGAKPQ